MSEASGTMKKVSMELGGNAPFIVFDDADIDAAVESAIHCKFRDSGQTCICANRFYIQKQVYCEFADKLAKKVSEFHPGPAFDPASTHGPLIDVKAMEKVQSHLQDALDKGAELKAGGKQVNQYFFQPAVLTNMKDDMLITKEEIFDPVAALYCFETEQDVIKRANDTEYGLAGYFFSRDRARAWCVAEKMEYGMVGVNTSAISNCASPFGGIKESGFGKVSYADVY